MKQRVDLWLVDNGYFQSREQAQRSIMAGEVIINGKRIEKASQMVNEPIEVNKLGVQAFVSRGGKKLEKALQYFSVQVAGCICLDAGASTGGFTDCLLQFGASHVYAVDVGYGQLAWKLRQDSRVTVFERENIRYFTKERLPESPSLITADLSFISLELVLPNFQELMSSEGNLITLIKPQFEAGKGKVGKKGVVRDKAVHLEVLERLISTGSKMGWRLVNLTFSPILGPEGNLEYLAHWRLKDTGTEFQSIGTLVDQAWQELKI
ncbi:MAG TPA: TlyA family rRNA (cytidine-2'-O)-methyltransferase [Firmicutes bacterium]|jgi:23S rRNA (cytidine1920-2'-O)/16S rRNA (cytidine1409-2'-O)-methyltransferase|nr:TlyA family rRNA (cytidine-2'-O)-methyltransferase [Bacillota bacterium]